MQPIVHDALEAERRKRKTALRAEILARRDALAGPLRAVESAAIAGRIAELDSWRAARTVLLTLPFRSEWDTWPLVEAALSAGKRIVLPRVDAGARALALHRVTDPRRQTAPGYRGIPEPAANLPAFDPAELDWILVPGVAFDAAGGRLGYGAGCYDRLLAAAPEVPRVAGAFELQIIDQVPRLPHDLGVDLVVTPTRRLGAA